MGALRKSSTSCSCPQTRALLSESPKRRCYKSFEVLQPLGETVWWSFKKLNIKLPYDLAIPLLGVHPKEWKTGIQVDTVYKYS